MKSVKNEIKQLIWSEICPQIGNKASEYIVIKAKKNIHNLLNASIFRITR
jgi:hypothetical protein